MVKYFLDCRFDSRKSFYNKARVEETEKSKKLYSYETLVAEITDKKVIIHVMESQTTTRHIKEFLRQNKYKAETTKQIKKDYNY